MKKTILLIACLYTSLLFADQKQIPTEVTIPNPYQVHAVVTSETVATISSPMAGLIAKLNVKDGSIFKKDDVLLQFDCRIQLADLQKTTAEVKLGQINQASYNRLSQLGSASKIKVAESVAQLAKAQAEQKIAQKQVSDCEIKAPFAGQITELYIHQNESVQLYQKLFDILDNNALVVKVLVPSDWLKWLKVGTQFNLRIDETLQIYPVKVERIVNEVDAVSRSVKVIAVFTTLPTGLKTGMSGDAIFIPPSSTATN